MATEVKRRRGSDSDHVGFTGAVAELTVNTDDWTVHVHDGTNNYGYPLLRQDFDNVPTTAPFTHITLDTAIFDTSYTETGSETQGTLYWNSDEETISLVTNGESFELGQKTEIHVKNQTGAQINKGEVVYASGTVGNSGRILITKMIANGTVPAKRIMGVAAENIANGADGKIITFGKLKNIDTSSFSDGDILYVSASTAGAFQNTEPSQASGHVSLPIAYVIHSHSNGQIFIRVTPIDENEYTDYADYVELRSDVIENHLEIESLQDNKVELGELFPDLDKQALGTGDNVTFGGLTVNGDITVTGNVDGRDVSADGADLDELYTTIGLSALTASEVDQLENINSVTINNTQWGYLGALDQSLTTTSDVQFDDVTASGIIRTNEIDAQDDLVWNTATEVFSTSDFYANNAVNIGSNVYITDELDVAESLTVGTTLDVSGNATLGGTANISSNTTIGGTLTLTGAADFNSTMNLQGTMTTQNTIQSDNFDKGTGSTGWLADGATGFAIEDNSGTYDMYVDSLTVRGSLRVFELIAKQISAIGGTEILSVANGIVESSSGSAGSETVTLEDPNNTLSTAFADNDLVLVQRFDPNDPSNLVKQEFRTVSVASGLTLTLTTTSGAPTPTTTLGAGDFIVAYGNTANGAGRGNIIYRNVEGQPIVRLHAGIDSYADFISPSTTTRIAYGDLNGFSGLSSQTFGFFAGENDNEHVLITDTGIFFKDGSTVGAQLTANEFKIGDSNNNLTFNTNTGAFNIKIGDETDLAASVAEIRQDLIDVYLADQSTFAGIQFLSGQITLKVGADGKVASARLDATGDESAITLRADFFDFQSDDIVLIGDPDQDGGTQAKIALGASADSITIDGTEVGFIADGSGEFKAYADANNYIRLADSALDIKTESFNLDTTNLDISSANENIVIGTSPALMTVGKLSSVEQGIKIDSSGITNQNYWKLGQGSVQFKVGDGTNFLSFNENAGTFDIQTQAFRLDTTASGGGIDIDSTSQIIKLEDASRIRTQVDINHGAPTVSSTSHINDTGNNVFDKDLSHTTTSFQVTNGDSIRVTVTGQLTDISSLDSDDNYQFEVRLLSSSTSGGTYTQVGSTVISELFNGTDEFNTDTVSFSYHTYGNEYFKVQVSAQSVDADPADDPQFRTTLIDVDSFPSVTRVSLDGVYVQNNDKQYAQLTRTKNELSGQIFLKNLPDSDPSISGQLYRDSSGNLKVSL